MDKFGISRGKTVTLLCVVGFLGGLVYCTGAGLYWLDIVDHFVMNYGAVPLAVVECIVFGWFIRSSQKAGRARGAKFLQMHINEVSDRKIRSWWVWAIRIVIPAILFYFTILGVFNIFTEGYGGYTAWQLVCIGFGSIVLFLVIALALAFRPWRREKHPGWEDED